MRVPGARPVVGLAAAAALCLGGCTDDPAQQPGPAPSVTGPPPIQLGGPGQPNRTLGPGELPSPTATWSEDDVAFMQAMIPHHQQALEMTALIEGRSTDRDLATMAERIDLSQQDEIAQLKRWLAERDQPPFLPREHGHLDMPGMLTAEDLDRLTAARGEEFDRLFLQLMIRHHQGAISMVEDLLGPNGDTRDSQVGVIANGIASDQAVEVARMRTMLAAS